MPHERNLEPRRGLEAQIGLVVIRHRLVGDKAPGTAPPFWSRLPGACPPRPRLGLLPPCAWSTGGDPLDSANDTRRHPSALAPTRPIRSGRTGGAHRPQCAPAIWSLSVRRARAGPHIIGVSATLTAARSSRGDESTSSWHLDAGQGSGCRTCSTAPPSRGTRAVSRDLVGLDG